MTLKKLKILILKLLIFLRFFFLNFLIYFEKIENFNSENSDFFEIFDKSFGNFFEIFFLDSFDFDFRYYFNLNLIQTTRVL